MAEVISDIARMQQTAESLRLAGRRIAVVPTMGALHEGHLTLIRKARELADVVIVTVFVNPLQFGTGEDLERYPRDLDRDASLASAAGASYIFAPSAGDMYPKGFRTSVEAGSLATVLEGRSRPGHFRGVATVVVKLLNLTRPHVAVFGQKDAQQVVIVRQLIRDLNMMTDLVVVPIVREADGLAMSSRNVYLTASQRAEAPILFRALQRGAEMVAGGERSAEGIIGEIGTLIRSRSGGVIDYISIADAVTLEEQSECRPGHQLLISLAVRFGTTRLIDNIQVTPA